MCLSVLNCCFCIRLDIGVKIISIMSVVLYFLMTLLYGFAAVMPSPVMEPRRVVYAIVTSVSMFQILLASLLVYGVFWKKPRWMIPWLATSWVSSVLLLALSIFGAVLLITQKAGDQETSAEVSSMVSVYFIYAAVLYYLTSVVNSRREELVREQETESSHRLMNQPTYRKDITL